MNTLINIILGYVIHDAIQPTAVGKVLDKVSLPADLIVSSDVAADNVGDDTYA